MIINIPNVRRRCFYESSSASAAAVPIGRVRALTLALRWNIILYKSLYFVFTVRPILLLLFFSLLLINIILYRTVRTYIMRNRRLYRVTAPPVRASLGTIN